MNDADCSAPPLGWMNATMQRVVAIPIPVHCESKCRFEALTKCQTTKTEIIMNLLNHYECNIWCVVHTPGGLEGYVYSRIYFGQITPNGFHLNNNN